MTRDQIAKIQQRLLKLGFNPGPVDGVRGRMTSNAVKRFQESRGLVVDGIVGPATRSALFGPSEPGSHPVFDDMPWYDEAGRLMGLREAPGAADNPEILEMAKTMDIAYGSDDIPWCGLFVGHCVASSLGDEPVPTNPLLARNWLKFGQPCEPQLGAILVFWREKKSSFKGHVGFYAGEDLTHYHVLGGNQSDAVNVKRIARNRLLGARWPWSAGNPPGTTVAGNTNVAESETEA